MLTDLSSPACTFVISSIHQYSETMTNTNTGITETTQQQSLYISHANGSLHVLVHPKPEAETVILLHGGPGVPGDMPELSRMLKDQFQVIYFEQRGTGQSICRNQAYTMQDYIADIELIAQEFNLQQFHLFGHSWGGLYAQVYAEQHPGRIKSMYLCSPSSGTNKDWKQTEKEVMTFHKKNTSGSEWLNMGFNSLLGMFGSSKAYRKVFRQVIKNYTQGYKNNLPKASSDFNLDGVFTQPVNKTRKEIIGYHTLKPMPNTPFPVLITYGAHDIYGASKQQVFKRYPNAQHQTIEACGHLPWSNNPIAFEKIVRNFYLS